MITKMLITRNKSYAFLECFETRVLVVKSHFTADRVRNYRDGPLKKLYRVYSCTYWYIPTGNFTITSIEDVVVCQNV